MAKQTKWMAASVAALMSTSLLLPATVGAANVTLQASVAHANAKAAAHGKKLGHKNSKDEIQLTFQLQQNHSDQLDAFIASLYNPSSPNYKHFLTAAEFTKKFGATDQTVAAAKKYLNSQGFKSIQLSSNRMFLTATGTVAQVENMLNVTLNNYKNTQSQVYFANEQEPALPSELKGVVSNVVGLDNENHWSHPQVTKPNLATPQVGSGPAGGYTPSELGSAYDVTPLINAGYDGTGQTVAVMELDGYDPNNIAQYDNNYNLGSPTPTNVYVDGYDGSAGQGQVEVELDIEVINAIAPKAQVMVYEAPNSDQGLIDVYQKIATDNQAQVTSVSWGQCEQQSSTATMNSLHTIFQQMAAQGQSIFDASGDSGAYDCSGQAQTLAVDSPANDPLVTGVGGTNLQINADGSYSSESVWGNMSNNSGGGGGLSTVYAMPNYQTGVGVQNSYSNGKREVPDVSADADPASGYSVYTQGNWTTVGGTSAAAPLWAGIAALNNQYAASNSKGNLGQANPTLYQVFNGTQTYPAFHDITNGSNLYYPATTGYDMASGIGTPDAYNLIRDINN